MAFHGKVVLITGGGSGMGQLAAKRMAHGGAAVAALDVNEAGLAQTAESERGIETFRVDVTDRHAVEACVKDVEARLGPIDRVYNAAAIMPTKLLMEQEIDEILRIMDINYGGTVNVAKTVLPGMVERRRGDLINFASVAGFMPALHFGAYNASKFAVSAFTEVLYHENRKSGVRFACVCPPPVATPLLEQATSKPKIIEQGPPIRPDQVLDAIEKCLEKRKLMVYPDAGARIAYLFRRFAPNLLWRRIHQVEGQ